MKLINLIPQLIKDERRNKKIQKTLVTLSLVPVGLYGFGQYEISQIEKKTTEFQNEILTAITIENEIRLIETEIFNDTRIVAGLSNEQFPLHRFLLFMGVSMPEDMRLYSVTSDNVEKIKETEKVTDGNASPVVETTTAGGNDVGGSSPDVVLPDTSAETAQTPEQIVEEERLKQIEEQKKIEESITSQKTLYIRGATLSINSLGIFMKELENNDYIEKVDIQDIENYYNAAQSYKFFELTVTLK